MVATCHGCGKRFREGNFNRGRAKVCADCRPEYRRLVAQYTRHRFQAEARGETRTPQERALAALVWRVQVLASRKISRDASAEASRGCEPCDDADHEHCPKQAPDPRDSEWNICCCKGAGEPVRVAVKPKATPRGCDDCLSLTCRCGDAEQAGRWG